MKLKRSQTTKSPVRLILACLLLLVGLYIFYTALSPLGRGWLTNPSDNQTTRLIESSENQTRQAHLYIPKIDVNVPYSNIGVSALDDGAWWRQSENGNPRDGGNFVLSAHRFIMGLTPEQTWRKSPFYNIGKLELGDEIIVDYESERYTYIIDNIYSVAPTAIEIEAPTDDARLTLYSCTLGGSSDGRDVIIAKPKA